MPSAATADLAVGVSLLGDGYATYDRGWQDHGAPWWFDSYAQVPDARLRLPVGPWTAQLAVPHPWQYRVGQTVLLNQEAAVVTGVTPPQNGQPGRVTFAQANSPTSTASLPIAADGTIQAWPGYQVQGAIRYIG